MIGQLPAERLTPGPVFANIGIDFAVPIQVCSHKENSNHKGIYRFALCQGCPLGTSLPPDY